MHITELAIGGIPPFKERLEFKLDERVNLFIGPNASGKSTILRMLKSRAEIAEQFNFQLSDDWLRHPRMNVLAHRSRNNTSSADGQKVGSDIVPWMYILAARLNLPLSHDNAAMHQLQSSSAPVTMVIEGEEIEPTTPLERMRRSLSSYYFDGGIIQKYYKAATDLFRMNKASSQNVALNQSAKNVAYACAQSVCSNVLVRDREPVDYIYHQPVPQEDFTITNVHDDMAMTTTDNTNTRIFAGDLSSGTQGTLLWIWYLALEIANFYNGRDSWHTEPAILLIDEIENNLHPTWQRRVIPALLEHFPGLQIFATTHSPFVVAGLKAGQVHLLNRDEDGVVTATTNTENIVGWTADEILQTMMGVDDPTDEATATAARRLRELRDEGPRSTADAEAERQADMQKQRQLVDRDLLAGGPKARRREEFGQRFREALERRRQTEELNQDNG